jgi:hypothetical protein
MLQISVAKMVRARRSKIARKNSKNMGLSYGVEIFREREWSGGWRGKWRARGPLTMPRRGLALAAPPCGEVA